MPSSRAARVTLPGVGRKTANVVLNMWFHHPAQAVDTHIFRVGNRTGICPGRDEVAVERAMIDADVSRAKRAERVDALAAAHILEGALHRLAHVAAGP